MNKLTRGSIYIILCSLAYYMARDNFFILLCTIGLISLIHSKEEEELSKRINRLENKDE